MLHGGYTQTRATIGMGDISAIFIVQTSGDTMIQNCSMLWSRSYPRARGTFGHWKGVFFPEQSFQRTRSPIGGRTFGASRERHQWFVRMQDNLTEADLLFVDPDNGLEPAGYSHGSAKAGKSVLLSELHGTCEARTLLDRVSPSQPAKGRPSMRDRVLG